MKGKTQSGFTFVIDHEQVINDMEIVEALAVAQSGEDDLETVFALSTIIEKILGKKQKKKLYDHIRTDDNRVPVEKLSEELIDIFNSFKEGKK